MHRYRDLVVWQDARRLVRTIYDSTATFPRAEQFNLTAQLRRAAVSIPSNIAEGAGRGTDREFTQILRIATGSACKLETQLDLASISDS